MEVTQFMDAERHSGGASVKLTFRDLVLSHLSRIGILASKEFRGGYYEEELLPLTETTHKIVKKYIPDSREEYSNAVNYLHDMLHGHFDDEMTKASEESDTAFEKALQSSEKEEKYRKHRVLVTRKLFVALCDFLKRQRYMEGRGFSDGNS